MSPHPRVKRAEATGAAKYQDMNTTRSIPFRHSSTAAALLALAPVATVWVLAEAYNLGLPGTDIVPLSYWLWAAVLAWSPLPLSLPAVLLERDRDAALPGYRGFGRVVRALRFPVHMLTVSPARVQFAASLLGFVAAAVLTVGFI